MIENAPGIYNATSVYNQGGAKPVVIPNDVTLYNKLVQTASISAENQEIKIYFPSAISNENVIGILGSLAASGSGERYEIESLNNSPGIRNVYLGFSWNYANDDGVQINNGGQWSTTLIPGGMNFFNKRFLFELEQKKVRNGFNGNLYGTIGSGEYGSVKVGGFSIPHTQYGITPKITIERLFIRTIDGVYLADCRPAVKGGNPGLYDVISGNFGSATDTSIWDVQEQVIY